MLYKKYGYFPPTLNFKDVTPVRKAWHFKLHYKIPEDRGVQCEGCGNLKSRIYTRQSQVTRLIGTSWFPKATIDENDIAAIGLVLSPDLLNFLNFLKSEVRKSLSMTNSI
jgi:hypothetical protein